SARSTRVIVQAFPPRCEAYARSSGGPGTIPGSRGFYMTAGVPGVPGPHLLPSRNTVRLEPCCAFRREATRTPVLDQGPVGARSGGVLVVSVRARSALRDKGRVVDVAFRSAAVGEVRIVRGERRARREAARQVGVGDEQPPEGEQVGEAHGDDLLAGLRGRGLRAVEVPDQRPRPAGAA